MSFRLDKYAAEYAEKRRNLKKAAAAEPKQDEEPVAETPVTEEVTND